MFRRGANGDRNLSRDLPTRRGRLGFGGRLAATTATAVPTPRFAPSILALRTFLRLAVIGLACTAGLAQVPGSSLASPSAVRAAEQPPANAPAPAVQESPRPIDAGSSDPVPEPSTLLLVGTGLVGVALTTRWRRTKPR